MSVKMEQLHAIINGDRLIPSISAAALILAKTARDAEMLLLCQFYP
jgi:ribonuclease HII